MLPVLNGKISAHDAGRLACFSTAFSAGDQIVDGAAAEYGSEIDVLRAVLLLGGTHHGGELQPEWPQKFKDKAVERGGRQ